MNTKRNSLMLVSDENKTFKVYDYQTREELSFSVYPTIYNEVELIIDDLEYFISGDEMDKLYNDGELIIEAYKTYNKQVITENEQLKESINDLNQRLNELEDKYNRYFV